MHNGSEDIRESMDVIVKYKKDNNIILQPLSPSLQHSHVQMYEATTVSFGRERLIPLRGKEI
jgi:hypothetical protein